jgi:hypothetical protein
MKDDAPIPSKLFQKYWLVSADMGYGHQRDRKGQLVEAAWNGFLKARKYGTYNILDFLLNGTFVSSNDPLKR